MTGLGLLFLNIVLYHIISTFSPSSLYSIYNYIFTQTCFVQNIDGLSPNSDEPVWCIWAQPGITPNLKTRFDTKQKRCCFPGTAEQGVFQAFGETVMSLPMTVLPENGRHPEHHHPDSRAFSFDFKRAHLMDVLAIDATDATPIPDVRVQMADASVHLAAYTAITDQDGYAVLPIIPGHPFTLSLRAQGYLPIPSHPVTTPGDLQDSIEIPIELDPGIELQGTVTDDRNRPIQDARLHVEVERKDQTLWLSDLDLPRPVSAIAAFDANAWNPGRGSWTSDNRGNFHLSTIPKGKIRIYATHSKFPPTSPQYLDATDADSHPPIPLAFPAPTRALLRIQNPHGRAIPARVSILDVRTGHEVTTLTTPASGAADLQTLPAKAHIFVFADGYLPLRVTRDVSPNDEILLTLSPNLRANLELTVIDENRRALDRVTLAPLDHALRTQYPTCLGRTDRSGHLLLEGCPPEFWLEAFHPDHAPAVVRIPRHDPIAMPRGTSLSIRLADTRGLPVSRARCTIDTVWTDGPMTTTRTESIRATNATLSLPHRPDVPHTLTCHTDQGAAASLILTPGTPHPDTLLFPHYTEQTLQIIDTLGAPVPYAILTFSPESGEPRRLETDEVGRITFSAPPDTLLTVTHYQHGQTTLPHADSPSPTPVRLPDTPIPGIPQCAQNLGLSVIPDGAAFLIDDAGPHLKAGIRRGDALESCAKTEITVVRDDRRIQIKLSEP